MAGVLRAACGRGCHSTTHPDSRYAGKLDPWAAVTTQATKNCRQANRWRRLRLAGRQGGTQRRVVAFGGRVSPGTPTCPPRSLGAPQPAPDAQTWLEPMCRSGWRCVVSPWWSRAGWWRQPGGRQRGQPHTHHNKHRASRANQNFSPVITYVLRASGGSGWSFLVLRLATCMSISPARSQMQIPCKYTQKTHRESERR